MEKELNELYDDAVRNYKESKTDYDAGVCEGLKRALEIIEKVYQQTIKELK